MKNSILINLKRTLQVHGKGFNTIFALLTASLLLSSCMPQTGSDGSAEGGVKTVQLNINDIRGKTITYDIYQVNNDELEYVATEVADRDGTTMVKVEVERGVNNIIIKRTKDGVEKRQVVPLRSDKVDVQFLL